MRCLFPILCCTLLAAAACQRADDAPAGVAPIPAAEASIELARGSEWHGFDSVHIPPQGPATLYRLVYEEGEGAIAIHHETATLPLSSATRAALRTEIGRLGLFALKDHYYAGSDDGTQWLLRVVDGGRTLRVYCDNQFPPPLQAFAEALDARLESEGLERVAWRRLEAGEALPLQDALRAAAAPSREATDPVR